MPKDEKGNPVRRHVKLEKVQGKDASIGEDKNLRTGKVQGYSIKSRPGRDGAGSKGEGLGGR
jgi:hypothetical protein